MQESRKKILVLGDAIVDRYVFVATERNCSEAPAPVWDEVSSQNRLGGAMNVALNLKSIAGSEFDIDFAGICDGQSYYRMKDSGIGLDYTWTVASPIMKTRVYTDHDKKMLCRFDNKKSFSIEAVETFEANILSRVERMDYETVIISDYRMGTVTEKIAKFLCENPPFNVIVDSKRKDLSRFRGATVIKLNFDEYSTQVSNKDYIVESLSKFCVVTKGADGADVRNCESVTRDKYVIHSLLVPTQKVKAVDVVGCGDTFTAALAFYMTKHMNDVFLGTKFANVCASKVVQEFGTSVVTIS